MGTVIQLKNQINDSYFQLKESVEVKLVLTEVGGKAVTAPPSITSATGSGGVDWGMIAAKTFIFLLPVAVFTFLMRKHLLRGVTFGAVKR